MKIVGNKVKKSVAIKDKNQLWEFGIIPYKIENIFNESQRKTIKLGMKIWEESTCIEFVEKNPQVHHDYVAITKLDCGCCYMANDPRNKGRSKISLNDGCDEISIFLHELGHVLGLHHEHEHPDRDQYVFIKEYNVERGYRQEFGKFSYSEVDTLNRPYDYWSIMHYPEDVFARSKYVKTIVPIQYINGTKPRIGNQVRLSDGDISAVNKLYKCSVENSGIEWRQSSLKILSLNIPESPGCMTDYLEIRKGFSDRGDILGRYCGNYTNLLLINEDMTVKYVRTQIPNTIISNDPITLQSPNFPSNYHFFLLFISDNAYESVGFSATITTVSIEN